MMLVRAVGSDSLKIEDFRVQIGPVSGDFESAGLGISCEKGCSHSHCHEAGYVTGGMHDVVGYQLTRELGLRRV